MQHRQKGVLLNTKKSKFMLNEHDSNLIVGIYFTGNFIKSHYIGSIEYIVDFAAIVVWHPARFEGANSN